MRPAQSRFAHTQEEALMRKQTVTRKLMTSKGGKALGPGQHPRARRRRASNKRTERRGGNTARRA